MHRLQSCQYHYNNDSVPARLGKGHRAKEIGHNLAREQPKFRQNLCTNDTKLGTLSRVNDQNLVLWAIDENIWAQICKHFTSIFTSAV